MTSRWVVSGHTDSADKLTRSTEQWADFWDIIPSGHPRHSLPQPSKRGQVTYVMRSEMFEECNPLETFLTLSSRLALALRLIVHLVSLGLELEVSKLS